MDIKENGLAGEHLKKSEEKYRTLIESMHQGIIVHRNYQIIFANHYSFQLLGYQSRSELMTVDLRDLYPSEDRASVEARYEAMLAGEIQPQYFERKLIRKDHLEIWANIMAIKVDWWGKSAVLVEMEDITERKRAEEVLRDTEAKFRSIMDHSLTVDLLKDLEGRYLLVNRHFLDLHGITEEQVIGKTSFDILPREEAENLTAQDQEVLKTGQPVESELDIVYPDGTHRMINIKFPVFSPTGEIIGVGTTATDITERKKLEAQFQQVQKLQAVGTLAGGVAHTFNNLFQVIMGNISQMMAEMDPSEPHYKKLSTIDHQVKMGSELTGQLLGFAREGRYWPRPTNLNLLLVGTSSLVGSAHKIIEIQQEIEAALWDTNVDEGQIEQVLMNILINACQAMPTGGVLCVKSINAVVDDNFAKFHNVSPGRYVKLAVIDTGIGMDQEILPRIFEPFFTTKRVGQGSGLGLASAYGIVNNHDGFITVDSEVGKGTIIDVYLPAIVEEAA